MTGFRFQRHDSNFKVHGFWSKYFPRFTLLFLLLIPVVFFPFLESHKSLVFYDLNQGGDGLVIHYNSFVYYGKFLRSLFESFMNEGQLTIPMWDQYIGFGQDTIQTLWFYAIGDPFAALSAFIPTKYSEIGYCAITLFELYCAGLSLSFFLLFMNRSIQSTLAASLVYMFSSYPLLISTLHPYFTLPMIMLPLLLVGIERLIKKKFDLFYILVVMLSSFSCFYFFYMLCIFIFLYALYRFFFTCERSISSAIRYGIKFLVNTLLGVGASAILLFPVLHSLISSTRVNADVFVPLLYPEQYYQQMLAKVMVGAGSIYNHQGYTALAPISLFATFVLAKRRREYLRLVLIAGVLLLFLSIPFFGHVFNGFSYVTNRWIWALDCFYAFLIATVIDDLHNMSITEWRVVETLSIAFLIACLIPTCNRTDQCFINIIVLLVFVVIIEQLRDRFSNHSKTLRRCILVMAAIAISINAQLLYSPKAANYVQYFGNFGQAYTDLINRAPGTEIKSVSEQNELYRFDTTGISEGEVKRNSNMLLKLLGTSHYYSTNSGSFGNFITSLELNNPMEQTYTNLDARAFIEALLGVKYTIVKRGDESHLPYLYDTRVKQGEVYSTYATKSCLPLAFSTNRILDPALYNRASAVERQQMLLQGIVIEDDSKNIDNYTAPETKESLIPYSIKAQDGVTVENNRIIVEKANASITLELDSKTPANEEIYCHFINLDYAEKIGERAPFESLVGDSSTSPWISISSNSDLAAKVHYLNNQNPYYCGHHNFIANLGHIEKGETSIALSFGLAGVYTFDSIEVIAQPLDGISEYVSVLPNYVVSDMNIGINEINGSVKASENEYLFISFLYSPGWSAYVDGQKVDIVRADEAFMAIPLTSGNHSFILKYRTPMLYEGALVSFCSIVVIICIYILQRRASNGIAVDEKA